MILAITNLLFAVLLRTCRTEAVSPQNNTWWPSLFIQSQEPTLLETEKSAMSYFTWEFLPFSVWNALCRNWKGGHSETRSLRVFQRRHWSV